MLYPADDEEDGDLNPQVDLEIEDPKDTGFPVPMSMSSEEEDASAASSRSWENHGTPVEKM